MTLSDYRDRVNRAAGKRDEIRARRDSAAEMRVAAVQALADLEKAQAFIQTVAQQTQEHLRFHIEDIVQLALNACFPGEYEFRVVFEIKRGQTEARLTFLKNGYEVNPIDASGGGPADLAAFALRIASWTLGKTNNVIILDEPFRFISKDISPRACEILAELSHRLALQFLVVTHNPDIIDVADRVFEVSQAPDGVSRVRVK